MTRPFSAAGLPALPAGQQYIGVTITMMYDGSGSIPVESRKLFGLNDQTGKGHSAISGPQGTTGLDGTYTSGTNKTGQMVFVVPVGKQLVMTLDGPVIKTQRTIFQIDPPNHPAAD